MTDQATFTTDADGNVRTGAVPTELNEKREAWQGEPVQMTLDDQAEHEAKMKAWMSDPPQADQQPIRRCSNG